MLVVILKSGEAVVFDTINRFVVTREGKNGKLKRLVLFDEDNNVLGDFNGKIIDGYYLTRFSRDGRETAIWEAHELEE